MAGINGLRYSSDDPYYRLESVHTCLYVWSPGMGEGGDWWSWPMGVIAKGIPRDCQDSPPCPWDTHYQFSIKTLISDLKWGPQTQLGDVSHSEGTTQLVPKPWKMIIIIPRRQRGTWEGVTVVTWCSGWICRMQGGLVLHTIITPTAFYLPLLRGAALCCSPTIFQNNCFCTRISNFSKSPNFSIVPRGFTSLPTQETEYNFSGFIPTSKQTN